MPNAEESVTSLGAGASDPGPESVGRFYRTVGWHATNGICEDARLFEDLRECAREYVSSTRRRVMRHVPSKGIHLLDMGSGPIQFPEYVEYSSNFAWRHCVDLSPDAIALAEARIGDHGVYYVGDFLDLPFEDDYFDCSISLHVIYHIAADRQEETVRKLISVTRPGMPIIIISSNPRTLLSRLRASRVGGLLRSAKRLRRGSEMPPLPLDLYFRPSALSWWGRFNDVADVQLLPWRSFETGHQRLFFPDNRLGRSMFRVLFRLEDLFPRVFVTYFQYPLIVLTKREAGPQPQPDP